MNKRDLLRAVKSYVQKRTHEREEARKRAVVDEIVRAVRDGNVRLAIDLMDRECQIAVARAENEAMSRRLAKEMR